MEKIVTESLAAYPKFVLNWKNGAKGVEGFFVGLILKTNKEFSPIDIALEVRKQLAEL